jgi:hypothetical protein
MAQSDTQNKNVMIMTFVVLAAMGILLAFNLQQVISKPQQAKYIGFNEVRGMAIEHKGLLYTLNFDQQNKTIENLNLAIPVGKTAIGPSEEPLNFSKLVIYRFNKPNLTLLPIQYEGNNLIFSVPEWNKNGYIKDISYGHLKSLLATTYDP